MGVLRLSRPPASDEVGKPGGSAIWPTSSFLGEGGIDGEMGRWGGGIITMFEATITKTVVDTLNVATGMLPWL